MFSSRACLLPIALAALMSACGGAAPAPEPAAATPGDPAPINDVRNRYIAAYNAGDAAALAALFAEDAISLPDHGSALEGRAAIQKHFETVFSGVTANISVTPGDTEVTGDIAHEHGTFSVTVTPKAGGAATTETGKYLVVLKREADGAWRVHHDIDNATAPHAPPAAAAAAAPQR